MSAEAQANALCDLLRETGKIVLKRVQLEDENIKLRATMQAILEALQDRYDGAPDSTTLWMGQHIDDLKAAIGEA
jgi:hypothetical protein